MNESTIDLENSRDLFVEDEVDSGHFKFLVSI